MDIYWIDKERKRRGPATVPDMISKVRTGELSADETLGWHAGAVGWVPLKELPALTDFICERAPKHITYDPNDPLPELDDRDTPPTLEEGGADPPQEREMPRGVLRVYIPMPYVRLLARLVDMGIYTVLAYALLYALHVEFSTALLPCGPLLWLGMLLLEPLLLCTRGTTPGKALFGIRVQDMAGGKGRPLTFGRAFARTMLVFVMGLGMMFSILPLFAMGFSRWQLGRHGLTAWDARTGSLPVQKEPSRATRSLVAVLLLICCLQCTARLMEPWTPAMLDMLAEQNPQLAEKLRALEPEQGGSDKS